MNVNLLGDWVNGLQQGGYYSFLRQEAVDASGLSAEAVKKTLQRLAKRKRIAKVTDSFYVSSPRVHERRGTARLHGSSTNSWKPRSNPIMWGF